MTQAVVKDLFKNREKYDKYKPFEKLFFLMPMMHSENPADGQTCIDEFTVMGNAYKEIDPDVSSHFLVDWMKYAVQHHDITQEFNRYPSRNKALGRENTAEETEHLKKGGGWGQ